MSESWLDCEIGDGMFSDEMVVVFDTDKGEVVSFFVPRSSVEDLGEAKGRLRVRVFEDGGQTWAVLPNEVQSIVPVNPEFIAA